MTPLRRLFPSCVALLLGCDDTTPDDPLGHYAYAEPVRELLPMFAAWDASEPVVHVPVRTSSRRNQIFARSSASTRTK
jgi:hypothetical protein